jgi:hypothetical protein
VQTFRPAGFLMAVAVVALGGGCGDDPPEPAPAQVAVCVSPSGDRKAGDQVKLEFRQLGALVASGSIPVGGVYAAPVPGDLDTEVFADGTLVGSGTGTVYLKGPGCPETPTG